MLREERSKDKERITALEKKNQQLQKDMKTVQKKSKTLENLEYSFGVLETATEVKIEGLRESVSGELSELGDNIDSLDEQLKFIKEGRINGESAAKITRNVLRYITTQLSPD
ncbi:hypothetical protein FLAG1_11160 [Fusarium langsethiae]|uniref:Uncharacterized protein n=1 Tax=Fusarium langsethiae TaxID=179993 RepID=A0A0M9EN31_FUSLA|nr:hypothetical protein FLAG1_11160 [Fusarium langsethiae]GKU08225.1 unnamed protein product [Fusarium langsethiae]